MLLEMSQGHPLEKLFLVEAKWVLIFLFRSLNLFFSALEWNNLIVPLVDKPYQNLNARKQIYFWTHYIRP